jgi:hypothetical protein
MADGDLLITTTMTVDVPTADEVAQAVALRLSGAPITLHTFSPPLTPAGDLVLVHGDSYLAADGRALLFSGDWPDLTGWALRWTARPYGEGATVGADAALLGAAVQLELGAADTARLAPGGRYLWDVQASRAGSVMTLVRGRLEVQADAT